MFKSVREMFIAVYKAKYANSTTRISEQFHFDSAANRFTNVSVQVEWVAFQAVLAVDFVSVNEVWVAAGCSPDITPTKNDLLTEVKLLRGVINSARE